MEGIEFLEGLKTPPSSEEEEEEEEDDLNNGYQILQQDDEEEQQEEYPPPDDIQINEDALVYKTLDAEKIEKNFAKYLPKAHNSTPHVLAAAITLTDEPTNGFDFKTVDFNEVCRIGKALKLKSQETKEDTN